MLNIAVMGYGVVGSGVVEVFYKNRESIQKRAGKEMEIKYILDLRDFENTPYASKFIKDFNIILNDNDIKIVVEVMGGLNPAFSFVKSCLEKGKSVVTSNKELVAAKGAELLKIAREHHVNFFFEASVGGGIPIIRPLHQCLAANEIKEIAGILNGTTNYILTKMIKEGASFEEALKIAQQLGYAERNPAADVEGHDACRKICILASLAFSKHVFPEEVDTVGITKITLEDVDYADKSGYVIKLIGRAKKLDDGKLIVTVGPSLISKHSQLASIDDVYNGIMVRGDAIGDVVFYGKGAGKLPTASAVVADVIDEAKHDDTEMSLFWTLPEKSIVTDCKKGSIQYYIRAVNAGQAQVETQFGKVDYLTRAAKPENEIAFITAMGEEGVLDSKAEALGQNGAQVLSCLRVLDY